MVNAGATRSSWSPLFLLVALFTALFACLPSLTRHLPERGSNTAIGVAGVSKRLPSGALPLDETRIGCTAQDATGQIWGFRWGKNDAFYRWDGAKWCPALFSPAAGAQPQALERAGDGAVLCLWNFNEEKESSRTHLLSEHKGNSSRIVARWAGEMSLPISLFRSRRATWITSRGTDIFRVRNGSFERVYQLTPRQMRLNSTNPSTNDSGHNSVQIAEDARGHTWFWANETGNLFGQPSLQGLLEFDGKTWTHHAHLKGVPDKTFTAFVPRDAHSFWLAVSDVGLFELDATTLVAKRLTDPIPFAFERIQTIQRVGGNWFLVADSPEARFPSGDYSLRDGDLWRWQASSWARGQGHFERIFRGLDRDGTFYMRADRPIVATLQGLWVGALSGGAWWLPLNPKRKAVHLDWRRGLELSDVSMLFLQRDGRLVAGSYGGTAPDLRAYLETAPAQTPAAFTSYGVIMEDARHHLWRVPNLSARVVQQWDGTRWNSFPLPAAYALKDFFYSSLDARGRLWLLPDEKDGKVALLQPKSASWRVFSSFALALQNQLETLGPTEFARLNIGDGTHLTPRFAAPNRIAFRSGSEKLFYFDGHTWRNWTLLQIVGEQFALADEWEQTPFFDSDGVLSINFNGTTWRLTPAGGWKTGAKRRHPFPETPTPTPPPDCGITEPDSITRDSMGAIWMTKDRQLWKAAWGLCVPQLSPTQRHPVRDGRRLERISVDAHGDVLLGMGSQWRGESVWLPSSAPDTRVSSRQQSDEAFLLRFAALPSTKENTWFRWRLDAQPWSALQTGSSLRLDFVSAGTHHFEVAAINARLQLDPTPATTTLRVNLSPKVQLNHFVAMLHSPNYAQREAAVKALAQQPARALPVLQAARVGAKGDTLWWINAALQAIEDQSHPKATAK